jgi:hypothetical protein
LTYQWRSTDGRIIDQDAPWTKWTLPAGPGIHFAYVLVSNGKGGYTERRIAVNTDGLSAVQHTPPMDLVPPPVLMSSDRPFRNWLGGGLSSSPQGLSTLPNANLKVAIPDVNVEVDATSGIVRESTSTSLMGGFRTSVLSAAAAD